MRQEEFEIFLAKQGDGHYHLLGYLPSAVKHMISERECSCLDLGVVILPEGRGDLVKGDVLAVAEERSTSRWEYITARS